MDTEKLNITNLTSLWKKVIKGKGKFVTGSDYDYSLHSNSDWPNRLWFHEDVDNKVLITASATIRTTWPFIIPYFDIYENRDSHGIFLECGYELKSEQYGMCLELNTDLQDEISDIYFEKVSHLNQATLWSQSFSSAFGYRISEELLMTDKNIEVLLVYISDKLVGTLMLHSSDSRVMGIHSMGIVPNKQRLGYGGKIMKKVISQTQRDGFQWLTLQASKAGLGLYQKLGFQQQYTMRNYSLK